MDLIIIRQNGETYKTSDYNMKVLKFDKGFPNMRHETETFDDRGGFADMGTFYDSRTMAAVILYTGRDRLDTPLVQNEIFRILDSREHFYIIDDREPGKRWKAKVESSFTPDQRTATFGTFDVAFMAQPLAESSATTLTPFTFGEETWQIGQGLDTENTETDDSQVTRWNDIGAKTWGEI